MKGLGISKIQLVEFHEFYKVAKEMVEVELWREEVATYHLGQTTSRDNITGVN